MADGLNMSRRIRRTPYTDKIERAGVRGFSVVNHMLLPKAFQPSIEEDYWHLREHVQLWDVSCQRQVQIKGPEAAKLVQMMTPRDIGKAIIGDCFYVPIIDANAGLINDPVMLKLAEDKFWLSIADSDVLLYALGLALGREMDVLISEPDVSPLAIQGPKAEELLVSLFGAHIRNIGFFKFGWIEFQGSRQLIARSGFSRQGGFEIYLEGGHFGADLWDHIWDAGQAFKITPGCPNLIERIEGGLFSYGNEMTRENNPLEIGLGKFCSLDGSVDYIGRVALENIATDGVTRKIRGIVFDGGPCPTCSVPWPVMVGKQQVGQITSGAWSPRLKANVGQSMIDREFWKIGQDVIVITPDGQNRSGKISKFPMN
jgi:dimethylsulfoniopropionate demethylase